MRKPSLSDLDTFVPPKPNRRLIHAMTAVNRVFILKGIPLFRDLRPFRAIPPFRGLANVRHIDFPAQDEARLKAACGPGKATFIAPNHPEFFTDWMIDKEVIARVAPLAASWATHGVVNGMGRLMQKFWLANNLIAQIPGHGAPARAYSVAWALAGHGVLLHPEGAVGWHGGHVGPLLPGAVEMALEALATGRGANADFEAWVAPVVWKLVFVEDVEERLVRECAYVERRLSIKDDAAGLSLPLRIHRIYDTLLARDAQRLGVSLAGNLSFAERQATVVEAYSRQLAQVLGADALMTTDELLRTARRRLRGGDGPGPETARDAKALADRLARIGRVGPFAFAGETVTQEELAEHLKRIRNDYCAGSLRDTLNRLVPQPAGPRRAHIRVPEPIALHDFFGSPEDALELLRGRMQAALDLIEAELSIAVTRRRYANPFHQTGLLALA
jgi:hypothetical protein